MHQDTSSYVLYNVVFTFLLHFGRTIVCRQGFLVDVVEHKTGYGEAEDGGDVRHCAVYLSLR